VATADGNVEIIIPPGALTDDTSISIDGMGEGFQIELVAGLAWAAFAVEIQPAGTVFNVPITITVPWDDIDDDGVVDNTWGLAVETNLLVSKDGTAITGTCQFEPGCDTVANTFSFQVSSLSEFVLFLPMDSDNDGLPDSFAGLADNCTLVPNGPNDTATAGPSQNDSNGDGFGNWCDADLDQSGFVNFGDLAAFKAAFGTTDADADFDGSGGIVNFGDLARFKALFGAPPGPSGVAP
jgi:hypothetical protein